uniref:Uncharacterized protein n=1 Tax=Rheinheimera sp. BAL341 TaxID=1708203 RepID=A0A486XU09_9GAMM
MLSLFAFSFSLIQDDSHHHSTKVQVKNSAFAPTVRLHK